MPIHALSECRLNLTETPWEFEQERRDEIARFWQEALRRTPTMWDGKVILTMNRTLKNGILSGECTQVSFSSYLAWRSWDCPDPSVFNCFGSAVIRSADGAILLGRMAASTANAGKVYPIAGMLDSKDVAEDGSIDIFASTGRELSEESGLSIEECRRGPVFAASMGQFLSVAQVLDFDDEAEALADRVRTFIASEKDPELDDVLIVRRPSDLDGEVSYDFCRETVSHVLG